MFLYWNKFQIDFDKDYVDSKLESYIFNQLRYALKSYTFINPSATEHSQYYMSYILLNNWNI